MAEYGRAGEIPILKLRIGFYVNADLCRDHIGDWLCAVIFEIVGCGVV